MKAVNRQFTEIINGSKQFVIPVFQRDYAWTTRQCSQMWDDIMRAGRGTPDSGHFMGSIVYVGTETAGAAFSTWLVIDGQQRMATLILLLTALRDHIASSGWTGGPDSPTVGKLDDFLKNRHEVGERAYKLALRRADNATLVSLLEGNGNNPGQSESVIDAYEWFRRRLVGCDPDVVYSGMARLSIVDVTLDRNFDNPQLVFESLNSTGVDLSQSDLIRNYLLMGLTESEQTRMYNHYWSKIESLFRQSNRSIDMFLRDYMALATNSSSQTRLDEVYDAFKEFKTSTHGESSLESLLSEMVRFAGYYVSLFESSPDQSKALSDALRNLRLLTSTHAVLCMKLYDCHKRESPSLSEEGFTVATRLIESYFVRRGILGWQSRDYWSVFANITRSIDEDEPLESLRVALARQRYDFPQNELFVTAIQESELYWRRDLCWHVLTRLENDGQKETSPVGEYSIEHIMPQGITDVQDWQEVLGEDWESIHNTWQHRLGNLTLTGYNSALSNRPFEEKKTIEGGFNTSAARLNHFVRQQTVWTASQMKERGEKLAKRALVIWPYHGADEKRLQEAVILDLKEQAARRSAANLRMGDQVRELLNTTLDQIRQFGNVIEVIERGSVCCYGPSFFVEILPMKYHIRLILPLDANEIEVPSPLHAVDTTTWSFVPNRAHTECKTLIDVDRQGYVVAAMPAIRKAFGMANE